MTENDILGPVEREILKQLDAEEAKLEEIMRRRNALTDWLEGELGLSTIDVENQPVSGCLDEAEQHTAREKLGRCLREAEKRNKRRPNRAK